MLNELEEFRAYTEFPVYASAGKRDTSYLGRFTFDMLLGFEGLARVLTIIARGYMWETDEPDIDRARRALCAWCSVQDNKKAAPVEEWQYRTDRADLHGEFPELVDENGNGWLVRHVHSAREYVLTHPDVTSKTAQTSVGYLKEYDDKWREKVKQYLTPIFSPETRGAWVLRFDDVLADALEIGKLKDNTVSLSEEQKETIAALTPEGVPQYVLETLAGYYLANKPDGSDWVVLPVTNFDAYFGNTSFSRKWLAMIPESFMRREKQNFGVCRIILSSVFE